MFGFHQLFRVLTRKNPKSYRPSGTRPEKTRTLKRPTRPDPTPKPSGSGRVFTWFGSPTGHSSTYVHTYFYLPNGTYETSFAYEEICTFVKLMDELLKPALFGRRRRRRRFFFLFFHRTFNPNSCSMQQHAPVLITLIKS